MQKKRLLVLSVDAMVHEDLSYLFTRPNFKRYMQGTSEVERVRTIYPSVTYPVHVSMLTGCYPDRHGIYSNFAFTTDSKEDTWHWFAQDVKVEDILTVAKRAGYSTGSVFWPVTGRHPDVDYLIDEYWMPNADDTLCGAFARAGSCDAVLKIIARHENLMAESHHKTGRTNVMVQPHIDDFLIACACDMIREFQPEVMLVHNGIIDGTRHKHGVFNDCVTEGLDLVDQQFGCLMRALTEVGLLEQTNLVVTSDHGQMNTSRVVKPNIYLMQRGYITLSPEGSLLDWKAYCMSNAMSCMVYLRNPQDRALHDEVYTMLREMAEEGVYGFSEVFTKEEIQKLEHMDGEFSFVLETDGYTSFSDSCQLPIVSGWDVSDFRFGHATHGYLPDKGVQPVFVVKGPDFKSGVTIDRRPIVDEAPTLAQLLGLTLPQAQGKSITELLK